MSDRAFAQAINQIAAEAEQQRLDEQSTELRRQRFARVRKICLSVIGAVLVITAYSYRVELGNRLNQLTQAQKPANSEVSKNLQDLRDGAAKRDAALDEIEKK